MLSGIWKLAKGYPSTGKKNEQEAAKQSFVQKLQVTRTLHSIFEDGSTADNIHVIFSFSFFFFCPEVHCCHPFKVLKVNQRRGVPNIYLFSKTASEKSFSVVINLSG